MAAMPLTLTNVARDVCELMPRDDPYTTMLEQLSPIEYALMLGQLNRSEDAPVDYLSGYYGISQPEAVHMMESAAFAQNAPHGGGYTRTALGPRESDFQHWLVANFPHPEEEAQSLTPAYDLRRYWLDMTAGVPGASPHLTMRGPAKHAVPAVSYPPQYDTPYSFGFGPKSVFYHKLPGER